MLPDHIRLKNINHITYNVKNKDAALQWYQDVLGLGLIPKMVNGDHLYWLSCPAAPWSTSSRIPARLRPRPTTRRLRWTILTRPMRTCRAKG